MDKAGAQEACGEEVVRSITSLWEVEESWQTCFQFDQGCSTAPPWKIHSTRRGTPVWARDERLCVWSCLGPLELTLGCSLTGAKGRAHPLRDFFPPSARCASPAPGPPQVGSTGHPAAAAVLRMAGPQVSLVLCVLPEFLSLWPRNS